MLAILLVGLAIGAPAYAQKLDQKGLERCLLSIRNGPSSECFRIVLLYILVPIMKILLMMAVLLTASFGTHAQTARQKISACVDRELAKVRTTEAFSVEGGVTCRAGIFKDFRCDKENKDQTVSYSARDGFVITQAEIGVRSKTDRGGVGTFSWNSESASVPISCRGNACDKGDREWSGVAITGMLQRIPTEEDRKSAMDRCLDEVLN